MTDPEARLFEKGEFTEAKLRYMTHALSEHCNGLSVDVEITQANGRAEWEAAQRMSGRSVKKRGATVGADNRANAFNCHWPSHRNQVACLANERR